jgi:hypothetical protein
MGTTRPRVDDLTPMICKIDKRLSGLANLMSYSARLVTVKSIISAMPNHIMGAMKLHVTHIDHIEKASRNFLWHGKDIHKSGSCLVKWEKVCLPKKSGGLGVLDLKQQNRALMIKNLYKFYNCRDIPWVQLIWRAHYDSGALPDQATLKGSHWWRSCISLLDEFKQITSVIPGNGHSILLWSDKWSDKWNASNLHSKFPQLFSFAKNKKVTLKYAIQQMQEDRYSMFHTPLSTIADEQCIRLQNTLNCFAILENESMEKDKWSLDGNSVKYSTKKVYLAITKPNIAPAPFMWIWDSACLPKQKFFFWLLLQDMLNTKELMK